MKKTSNVLLIVLLCFTANSQINDFSIFFDRTDAFLQEYVAEGKVAYDKISSSPEALKELIGFIAEAPYKNENQSTQKAFLVNAYNLLVINQIVSKYPVASPMDIDGFFKANKQQVGGEALTLDFIENSILRRKFPDPRHHFVLVCGAVGCPPLDNKAIRPATFDAQLESMTVAALNKPSFVFEKDGVVNLSEIFQWYAEDFGSNKDSILAYINSYRTPDFVSSKVMYYPYDWSVNSTQVFSSLPRENNETDVMNLQTFTAGSLLRQGQMDFTMFNSMYTQTKSNWLGVDYSGFRETFFTSLLQFTIGVDKRSRFNLGVDINLRASAYASDPRFSSVGAPFAFKNTDSTRVGLTSVGLRAKVAPFKTVKDFAIQTTVFIPTIRNPEGTSDGNQDLYWADWDRITMWNQIFYSKTWNKFQLFMEVDALFRFKYRANQISHVDVPVTVIGSYFPTSKLTLYGIASHNARFTYNINQVNTDWVIPAVYTNAGAGVKYQVKSNFTIEFLYTKVVYAVNAGLGSSFSLGFKFLTK